MRVWWIPVGSVTAAIVALLVAFAAFEMGNSVPKVVPPRPPVAEGRIRVCVAGFKFSHNVNLAKKVAQAITDAHGDVYESWFYFDKGAPYRTFINEVVKPELNAEQQEKFKTHKSAPFTWLEYPDGTRDCKGGGDRLREWALATFAADDAKNEKIRELAGREPSLLEAFVKDEPGTAPTQ